VKTRLLAGVAVLAVLAGCDLSLGVRPDPPDHGPPPIGTDYYVDSDGGSDANPGTSPETAWSSLDAVEDHSFGRGDVIHLRRGSSWYGDLEITDTGFGIYTRGSHGLFTENHIHDLHIVNNTPGGDDDYGAVAIVVEKGAYNEVSSHDLHLKHDSPAVDAGVDLGYAFDFDRKPVPAGSAPDIGAFEY
jgi:hypothetical protein